MCSRGAQSFVSKSHCASSRSGARGAGRRPRPLGCARRCPASSPWGSPPGQPPIHKGRSALARFRVCVSRPNRMGSQRPSRERALSATRRRCSRGLAWDSQRLRCRLVYLQRTPVPRGSRSCCIPHRSPRSDGRGGSLGRLSRYSPDHEVRLHTPAPRRQYCSGVRVSSGSPGSAAHKRAP
jgi:hypothetical protein